MSKEIREEVRENWGTRTGFILAAVGSAVGLGNLWGFPYKLYDHGGGAFLVPYIIGLILIGIPMMILEFSLGHRTQRAAPDAFGKLNRRFEIVGWWGILLGFVIICYYPVILAYCFTFLWESLKGILTHGGELPWAGEGLAGVKEANNFFFVNYLHFEDTYSLGSIQSHILIPLAITWLVMYLCICTGVKLVGKIVWLTVPVPWIMLLILAVRGLTLPGADQGLAFYLDPDWSELAKPSTWSFAFGQVFFSLSLAFGVMITYSSFLHRESDVNNNAAIISLADLATSFVAGLAVFATLGGMAFATQAAGQPVAVENVIDGGPGLAFVAFPYALAQLPYSAVFSFVFFFALVTLGVDSAFSITESVLASVVDKTGWRRAIVLPCMTVVGLLISMIFTHSAGGLNWLGTVDEFINGTWGIAFMGLLECAVLGWLFRISLLRKHANERSDWNLGPWWDLMIRIVIPVSLATFVTWNLVGDWGSQGGFIRTPEGEWITHNLIGMAIVIAAPLLALFLSILPSAYSPDNDTNMEITNPLSDSSTLLIGLAGFGVIAAGCVTVIAALKAQNYEAFTPRVLILIGVILGVIATGIAQWRMSRDTSDSTEPSWLVRWAGFLGTIQVGAGLGLYFALKGAAVTALQEVSKKATTEIDKTPEFGVGTWYILAAVGAVLIIGFSWCFYRALMAASRET